MASRPIIPLPVGQYCRFSLNIQRAEIALLPTDHEFVLNPETGHFIVMNWTDRYVVADGVFSQLELPLVLTLLSDWPSYIQNERLLQALTGQAPEDIAEMLDVARDATLEPLHRMVECCQERLHRIGIKIEDIDRLGYKLSLHTEERAEL